MEPKDVKLIDEARAKFDAISDKARQTIYQKVLAHYKKHPGSPWSGAPLRDLEMMIRQFYSDMGLQYDKVFRDTLPPIMQTYYDRAVEEMKTAGIRNAILGKPDSGRVKYFLDSGFEQVAMKTQNMCFQHIRALRTITADVTRQMSITGATRRQVSKELLSRAMEIPGFEFIDKAGTKWQLKSYFNMLARTELMNAARASYDDKCAAEGGDVMMLDYSGNCCEACAKYEGQLFSLTGATPGLPTKTDLEAAGVFHPNCTHSYSIVPDYIRERDYDDNGRPKKQERGGKEVAIQTQTKKQSNTNEKMQEAGSDGLYQSGPPPHTQAANDAPPAINDAIQKVMPNTQAALENAKNEYTLRLREARDELYKMSLISTEARDYYMDHQDSPSAKQAYDDACKAFGKVRDKYLKLQGSETEFISGRLSLPKDKRAEIHASSLDKKAESISKKASAYLSSMTAKSEIPSEEMWVPVVRSYSERSCYNPDWKNVQLVLSGCDRADVGDAIHEFCHYLEDHNQHIHAKCLEFLDYRCKGETPELLSKLTGNPYYDPDEYARPDKFFKPYCGKVYADRRATEILSMGVEKMYEDPVNFYQMDPEYFSFVYNVLRGAI